MCCLVLVIVRYTFMNVSAPTSLLAAIFLLPFLLGCHTPSTQTVDQESLESTTRLLNMLISYKHAAANVGTNGNRQLTKDQQIAESLLDSRLNELECGIQIRMAFSKHLFVLKHDSGTNDMNKKYRVEDDEGAVFLAELRDGDVLALVSTTRPIRTTIFRISRNYECKLLYDNSRFNKPLETLDTVLTYVGEVALNGRDSFTLAERWTPTSSRIIDLPRLFLLNVKADEVQFKLLGAAQQRLGNR